jgi:hypothetical protein
MSAQQQPQEQQSPLPVEPGHVMSRAAYARLVREQHK